MGIGQIPDFSSGIYLINGSNFLLDNHLSYIRLFLTGTVYLSSRSKEGRTIEKTLSRVVIPLDMV